jgi:hypothetical protein
MTSDSRFLSFWFLSRVLLVQYLDGNQNGRYQYASFHSTGHRYTRLLPQRNSNRAHRRPRCNPLGFHPFPTSRIDWHKTRVRRGMLWSLYRRWAVATSCNEGNAVRRISDTRPIQQSFLFSYFRHLAVNACLSPIVSVDGKHVITVEGLGNADNPHPLQERLWKMSGSPCGFCTVCLCVPFLYTVFCLTGVCVFLVFKISLV